MSDRQYIAYYRVSTEEQGKVGHGLDAQRSTVQRYLEAHSGELIGEHTEVESGKRDINRPKLHAALAECRRRRSTLIIATTGNDTGNDCTNSLDKCATLSHAVSQANAGDIIDLEAGTYNEPGLVIDKPMHIQGQGVVVQ